MTFAAINRGLIFGIALGVLATAPATAQDWLGKFDLKGSLGERGGHTRYVPPLSNPLFNETPYITTEIRPIYIHQDIPKDFAGGITGGGNIDLGAAEIRVALTERLGFIASKDGYGTVDFKRGLPDDEGFANISFGFKYAVISDPKNDGILTVGVEYEPPTGDLKVGPIQLQGDGDGFIDVFVTGAKAYGKLGLQASVGANFALDGYHDSSMFHWSVHADYEVLPGLFPLIEFNGFTTIDKGRRNLLTNEGIDLVNFGSVESGTVVTMALGARYRLNRHVAFGAGYEFPITEREDLMNWRIYADLVISY